MIKYLELCVELKKSYVAKEGIYQYKIICQQTYINSFEDVVRKYLEMAEEKALTAKEASQQSILDVDDLDNAQTPEDILLSAVSNEDTQDRTDRVVLIPWVKFLWESYRQCLDLLKNNSRTERLYHDIAHQAFRFCIKYNRKTEFRKLCDNLHTHLDILKKQQLQNQQIGHQQQNAINLSSPESQAMHLETRLVQLDSAIQMELWQEAYKATDDIKRFNLMNLTKKPPKPQLMANYYQKLALVFWKANCPLFHSAALFRLFHLSKELRKNITPEDIQKMATKVVAATLAIPIPPNRPEIDKLVDTEENIIENHQRNLASLLGLTTTVPNRGSLIKDLKRMNVLQHALPPLQELYRCLEVDFHPLVLCNRVQQVIDFMEKSTECPELKQYITALKDVTTMRLLKEVSQVYQTIEFTRLLELCPFASFTYMEKMVVEAARRNDLQVRIDHKKGCLIFGTELRVSTGEELIEGPHLQSMPSEQIRKQLVTMYSTLQKARNMIEPERVKVQREDIKRKIMKAYRINAIDDHRKILKRQDIIETRKEYLEQITVRREEEERRKLEEQQERIRQQEREKMELEKKEREQQMKLKQDIEIKKQMAKDQISLIKGSLAGNLLDNLDDEELAKMRPEDIHSRRIEQLEKERREQLAKQRKLERKIDHLERAKRIEEIPLLQEAVEKWRIEDKQLWEQKEEERIKELKAERVLALQHRERFKRVLEDKETFAKKIITERHSVFVKELENFETILNAERERRLAQRKTERKEERRKKYYTEKAAEEKRKADEEKRIIEEQKAAKFREQAEKQRLREEEIEKKQKLKDLEEKKVKEEVEEEDNRDNRPLNRDRREPEVREENDWRKPDRRSDLPDRRGPAIQSSRGDTDEDWKKGGERPLGDRERTRPPPPSRADEENNWRRDRPAGRDFDRNDRIPDRRRPPPTSRADEEEDWKQVGKTDRNPERRPNRPAEEEGDWRRNDRTTDRSSDRPSFQRSTDRPFTRNTENRSGGGFDRNPVDRGTRPPQSRADEDSDWQQVGGKGNRNVDRGQSRPEEENDWRSSGRTSDRNFERKDRPFVRDLDRNANRRDGIRRDGDRRDGDRRDGDRRDGDRRDGDRKDGRPTQTRADESQDWRKAGAGKTDRNSNFQRKI